MFYALRPLRGLFFVLALLVVMVQWTVVHAPYLQSAFWPTASARVTSATTVNQHTCGKGGICYDVDVEYAYTVDGVEHTAQRVLVPSEAFASLGPADNHDPTVARKVR